MAVIEGADPIAILTSKCSMMHYSAVQYSAVRCSILKYSAVNCSTAQYSAVLYSLAVRGAGCPRPPAAPGQNNNICDAHCSEP